MSRNLYCGGKPPSPWQLVAPAPSARQALLRLSGWLLLLVGWPLLSLAAVEKPPECPEFKSLCVQADRSGGIDLKSGTAVLEGNVAGTIKARNLSFFAQSLKAYRNEKNEWVRLVLDGEVRLTEPGRTASAGHAVLEREQVLLFGQGRVEQASYLIEGDEIRLYHDSGRIAVRGAGAGGARIEYSPAGGGPPENLVVRAGHAVIDQERGEIELTGKASMYREAVDLRIEGERVRLNMDDAGRLQAFRAEGGVVISQPGRTMRADAAFSRNDGDTILLVGNARIEQEGEFQLSSERLEVYTDAKKGIVQGGQGQQPIKLAIDLARSEPYLLNNSRVETLNGKGVPRITLDKLSPMLGRSYANRKGFTAALRKLLNASEAKRFLATIADHAR